ncbi:MAG: CDP-alcohol phosphatidyltransferase family protein [Gemmatimonadota bacterium]|uniref:CDP-alcohol phosphatidyltransferase family protein n=1 Tax=Candidatus Palauibacter scopulicola TaxID=3056741 RepID=UPI00239D1653|nr:CDP-alcohol phosphatidyltransferase family protein [Candidatus Palauibacter scopulicola]MDE2663889.1 CDP-alcohol phosphatidyltransferase family protein [Candidatus Palauibacter scopulicola]
MRAARDLGERALRAIFEPAMAWLTKRRVHPNAISTLGFVITCSSGYFFHQHHVSTAGFLVLLGGVFDLFDGTVARRTGLASSFGAFYDSTLDRLSEIVVYLGLLSLYNDYRLELGDVGMIYWIVLALAGSLMISYTRARAEALGIACYVGLMQRPERVILIGFAALIFGETPMFGHQGLVLRVVIIVLAILTNLTAFQRIWWVYRNTRPDGEPPPSRTEN